MGTPNDNIEKKIDKLKTEQIQKKLSEGAFNEAECAAAKKIVKARGEVPAKPSSKKAAPEKKAAPAKKAAPEKKAAGPKKEGEEGEKKTAPKKKSDKVGETKSDKMRVMLLAGKTTKEIIEAFEKEQITVRYPEIRRNRIWLTEKESWIDPHKPVEGAEKATPAKKAAAPKKSAKKDEAAGGEEKAK